MTMSTTFRAAMTAATLVLGSAQRGAHGPPPLPSQIATPVTPPGYRALPAAMPMCRLRGFPGCLNSVANRDSVRTTESRVSFRHKMSGGRTYLQIVESSTLGPLILGSYKHGVRVDEATVSSLFDTRRRS